MTHLYKIYIVIIIPMIVQNNHMSKNKSIFKVIVSCLVGFINGFFGGGGGLLGVVALKKIYNLDTKKAHATTVAIILPISLISSAVYLAKNTIELNSLTFITIGVVLGGILGALTLKKLNSNLISWIFTGILFVAGVRMII